VLHNAVAMDNLLIDGNTISNTVTEAEDMNINLAPPAGGSVIVSNQLKLDNMTVNGNTVSSNANNLDANLYLTAQGNGRVIIRTDLFFVQAACSQCC